MPAELADMLRKRPSVEQYAAGPAVSLREAPVPASNQDAAPRFPRPPRPARPPGLSLPLQARWKELLDRHDAIAELDHFALLGIPYECGVQHVQRAFAEQIKHWHPDKLPGELEALRPYAMRIVARLNDARQELSSRIDREAYLRRIGRAHKPARAPRAESRPVAVGRVELRKREAGVAAIAAREERLRSKRPSDPPPTAAARLLRALRPDK
jgi:hypothetical protein